MNFNNNRNNYFSPHRHRTANHAYCNQYSSQLNHKSRECGTSGKFLKQLKLFVINYMCLTKKSFCYCYFKFKRNVLLVLIC